MGGTGSPSAYEDSVLQPPSHPWWHWMLLMLTGVTLAGIALIILIHNVIIGAGVVAFSSLATDEEVYNYLDRIEEMQAVSSQTDDVPPLPATPPIPPSEGITLPPIPSPTPLDDPLKDTRKGIQWHVVESGDSYWSIAKKHGVTSTAIEKANPDIIPTRMRIGQKLIIPPVDPRPPKKVIPEKLLVAPIPSPDTIPDSTLPTEPHQESSLSPNPDLEPFPAPQPHPASTVKRATDSPIKISRETKTHGSSSPQFPKANLPEKPPIPPENIGQPNLNNIPGIARYQYNRPGRPQVGDNEKARKIFNKAYHHHKLNQLDEAIVGYREVLVLDPGFQQAHLNSAIAHHSRGEFKKALPSYELALAINPLSKISRYGFAQSLHRGEFYVDAAREHQKLLEVYQDYVPGHLALADLYSEKLKMPDRARVHYRKVLELNPQHPEAPVIREWLVKHP